jgi:hypothetical protein
MEKEQYSKGSSSKLNRNRYYHEHILQYVLLVAAFIVAITLLFQLKDFTLKFATIVSISLVYLVWGLWHHAEEGNLNRFHVLEYIMVSVIIFAVLTFVFLAR